MRFRLPRPTGRHAGAAATARLVNEVVEQDRRLIGRPDTGRLPARRARSGQASTHGHASFPALSGTAPE